MPKKCALCKNEISRYNPSLNRLETGENAFVDICQTCIDKFLKWQQGVFSRLFPTPFAKKFRKKGSKI